MFGQGLTFKQNEWLKGFPNHTENKPLDNASDHIQYPMRPHQFGTMSVLPYTSKDLFEKEIV